MARSYYEPRAVLGEDPLGDGAENVPFQVISQDVLFATPEERCHACDGELSFGDGEGYSIPSRGLLLFSRGDERRAEEPALCPACSAAIGLTMLTRWAIEEEEG